MPGAKTRTLLSGVIVAVLIITSTPPFAAQAVSNEWLLHSFQDNGKDGNDVLAGLVSDATGNLYGTTAFGGAYGSACGGRGCGTVFELTRRADGKWTEKILHSFNEDGTDGVLPAASVIFDKAGNFFGTTSYGGAGACAHDSRGCGTIFELTPGSNGKWMEKILHNFADNGEDGWQPWASMVLDEAGHFFGTTQNGGTAKECLGNVGCGTVFELASSGNGHWVEKVLYRFDDKDGASPLSALISDKVGNLYGTTSFGGLCHQCGTVFELKRGGGGGWTETILHNFRNDGKDGFLPQAALAFDADGNLFGTTANGGESPNCVDGCGTVFKLTPGANGGWSEEVVHSFQWVNGDGAYPLAGVIIGKLGELYGTTEFASEQSSGCAFGYGSYGCGTVFQLRLVNGRWRETVLHTFVNPAADGNMPFAGLIFDKSGNLYGTSSAGGSSGCGGYGCGTVFEVDLQKPDVSTH